MGDPLQMYLADVLTVGPDLAGVPALAQPCGFTKAGLPIGLQIIEAGARRRGLLPRRGRLRGTDEVARALPPEGAS